MYFHKNCISRIKSAIKKVSTKKILIVAVHPEDEVLGCRGTRAKYKKEGNKIYCLFLNCALLLLL